MNLLSSSLEKPTEIDVSSYSRWQDIFRTWFWRYYDHLFQLVFCNLGWFLSCFCVEWLSGFLGMFSKNQPSGWFGIYLFYLAECAVSVGWALAVFKIIMEDEANWSVLLSGVRRYFRKAVALSALSGFVLGLALFNLRFYLSLPLAAHLWILPLVGLVATIFICGLMVTLYQWPILFFQDPSLGKIYYRSFVITLGAGPNSFLLLILSSLFMVLFFVEPFLWFFVGFTLLFSLYVVALEKHFLRYKITYQAKSIGEYLEFMDKERQRGWRNIFRPWEMR